MKKRILNLFTLIALFVATLSLTACAEDKDDFNITDCVFSSFTAQDFDGNIVDATVFAEYKLTMINVWGTFCDPCLEEIPYLAEINREYADKGFQVIGIPVDSSLNSAADARKFIAELNADYRHLKVSNSIKQFVRGTGIYPYTIFVNKEGKQIGEPYTAAKSKSEWKSLIDKMLEFVNNT